MKVGQTTDALPIDRVASTGVRPAGNGQGDTPDVTSVPSTDKVQLSTTSQQLTAPTDGDSIDIDKVNKIRAQIAEGKFKVDVQKIADHMINEAASLLENIVLGKARP